MRVTIPALQKKAQEGEKIAALTCYDASFAGLLERAGVDLLLIGDSLGMVIQGHDTTLPVTIEQIEYHVRCVAQGSKKALIVADLPFATYHESPEQAYRNAARLLAAGAQMVKLEGDAWLLPTIQFLVERDIPVFGHLGLTPQSIYALGGYRVQGRTESAAADILASATRLQNAGIGLLLLEAIPAKLATEITLSLTVPTIGIGAGAGTSGQVLVTYDVLGIYSAKTPRFVKNFLAGAENIEGAVAAYVKAVKSGSFPGPEHSF